MNTNNIIDAVIKHPRSRELVRQIIPILIRWAKLGQTNHTYNDLNHALGYTKFSAIGKELGYVSDVMTALSNMLEKETGERIPTLNALCKNSSTGLPSEGLSYVFGVYNTMDDEAKKTLVDGANLRAIRYQKWDWVMKELGLKTAPVFTDEELLEISKPIYGSGGEGKEHKALKEYVAAHPETIGIKDVAACDIEHVLPSGDRLDVYFVLKNGNRMAVEVKPSTSPDEDITRGIFQCVKYKAVMDAMRTVECGNFENMTLLVCGGEMSKQNIRLAEELDVEYVDELKIK